MEWKSQRCLLTSLFCAGLAAHGVAAPTADTQAEYLKEMKAVVANADAIERVWCRELVEMAAADVNPRLLRCTLKGAVLKKDFTFEAHLIAGRWESGQGWAPAWNQAVHSVTPRSFKLRRDPAGKEMFSGEILVALQHDGYIPLEGQPLQCAFRITATVEGGELTGTYTTFVPVIDKEQGKLDIPNASGGAAGSFAPFTAQSAPPTGLPAYPEKRLTIYKAYDMAVAAEARAARRYADLRAVAVARKYAMPFNEAREEGLLCIPARPVFDTPTVAKAKTELKTGVVSLDDAMDDMGGLGLGDVKPVKAKATVQDPRAGEFLASLRNMRAYTQRQLDIAEHYARDGLEPVDMLSDSTETGDPQFGPWYGEGRLAVKDGRNQLPAGLGGDGTQDWLSVPEWNVIGPFPTSRWDIVTPGFPRAVFDPEVTFYTEKDRMKYANRNTAGWKKAHCWRTFCIQGADNLAGGNRVSRACPPNLGGYLQMPGAEYSGCYFECTIDSPEAVTPWVAVGVTDRGRLWLNGKLFWQGPMGERDSRMADYVALMKMPFKKGANRLLVRLDVGYSSAYMWMRVCARGKPRDAATVKADAAAVAAMRQTIEPNPVVQFRGDNTSLYPDARPPVAWNRKTRDNVLWFTPLPYWASSTAVPAPGTDCVFTTMGPHWLICCSKTDGRILWQKPATLLDLLPEDLRKQGWDLCEKAKIAREANEAIPAYETRPHKWLRHTYYWAEGTGIWRPGKEKDEREGASPELLALLDKRDELRLNPDPTEVKDELSSVEEQIEELKEKAAGSDPNSPAAIGKRAGRAEGAFIDFVGEYSYVQGSAGYWYDYSGYAYPTPITDGKHVWIKTGMDVLACFDMQGNRKWMVQIFANGNTDASMSSPVMADGKIVIKAMEFVPFTTVGPDRPARKPKRGSGRKIVAYDAATGEIAWEQHGIRESDWNCSTPCIMTLANARETMKVVCTSGGAVLRLDDGKVLVKDIGVYSGFASVIPIRDIAVFTRPHLCPVQLIMIDRDTVGFRRLWVAEHGFHGYDFGGVTVGDDRIYTQARVGASRQPPGPKTVGLSGDEMRGEQWKAIETHDLFSGDMTGKSVLMRKGGNHYAMGAIGAEHVYLIDGDSIFQSIDPKPPMIVGVATHERDPLVLANNAIGRTYGACALEGDRLYLRTYTGLICVGYTGEEGRRYEAVAVARKLLDDVCIDRPVPAGIIEPPMREAKAIKAHGWGAPKFVDHGIEGKIRVSNGQAVGMWWCFGPLPIDKADAALKTFGGPGAVLNGDDAMTVDGIEKEWALFSSKREFMAPRNYKQWEQDYCNLTDIHRIRRVIDFGRVLGEDRLNTVTFLMSDLYWEEETVQRFEQTMPGVRAWLGGVPVKHGDRVRFKPIRRMNPWTKQMETVPGYCQLLLEIKVSEIPRHGLFLSPRFWRSDDVGDELKEWQAAVQRRRPYYERVSKLAPESLEAELATHVLRQME